MSLFIVCMSLFIVICVFIIWLASTYNRFQELIIRMNEAESNIDSVLRKRFDLINKSIDIIKAVSETSDDVMPFVNKIKSRKLSNFELDRILYDGIKEFNFYKEKFPKLKSNESFMKIDVSLTESEAEIIALRKYYNDITTDYNKIMKAFPSNFVPFLFKFKPRLYFDGKDMSDDDVKDFKL